jgi:hypothetical protein
MIDSAPGAVEFAERNAQRNGVNGVQIARSERRTAYVSYLSKQQKVTKPSCPDRKPYIRRGTISRVGKAAPFTHASVCFRSNRVRAHSRVRDLVGPSAPRAAGVLTCSPPRDAGGAGSGSPRSIVVASVSRSRDMNRARHSGDLIFSSATFWPVSSAQ